MVRWLQPAEIVEHVNPALARNGWAELNLDTCRVLGSFDDDGLVEVLVLQLFPLLGPMLRLDNEKRDGGETTRELAEFMFVYLQKEQARGFFAIAESPFTKRICVRFGMKPLESPVYGFVNSPVPEEVTQ